jgi:hypothetical protein
MAAKFNFFEHWREIILLSKTKTHSLFWKNLVLVLSAGICYLASFKLSVQILNSEKAMVMKMVKTVTYFFTLTLASSLLSIMFIDDNKCVCIVYIFILTVDAFRAIRLAIYTKDKHKVDLRDYLVSLKWISFGMLSFIFCGSIFFNIAKVWKINSAVKSSTSLHPDDLSKGYVRWLDNFLLFYEKEGNIPRTVR